MDQSPTSDPGLVVHHPGLGIGLKEQMDELGVECVVQYRGAKPGGIIRHGGGEKVSPVAFMRKHFEAASK